MENQFLADKLVREMEKHFHDSQNERRNSKRPPQSLNKKFIQECLKPCLCEKFTEDLHKAIYNKIIALIQLCPNCPTYDRNNGKLMIAGDIVACNPQSDHCAVKCCDDFLWEQGVLCKEKSLYEAFERYIFLDRCNYELNELNSYTYHTNCTYKVDTTYTNHYLISYRQHPDLDESLKSKIRQCRKPIEIIGGLI